MPKRPPPSAPRGDGLDAWNESASRIHHQMKIWFGGNVYTRGRRWRQQFQPVIERREEEGRRGGRVLGYTSSRVVIFQRVDYARYFFFFFFFGGEKLDRDRGRFEGFFIREKSIFWSFLIFKFNSTILEDSPFSFSIFDFDQSRFIELSSEIRWRED